MRVPVYRGTQLIVERPGTDPVILADDVTFDEACEYMLELSKQDSRISPAVRKELRVRKK